MATKKKTVITENYGEPPKTLNDHPFYGLELDEDQKKLVDSVWAREKQLYLVDSVAGSGKTLIATALGILMVKYGIFDRIVYVTFPGIYEKTQGFLPGDLLEKSEPYFQPLYDALLTINELADHVCNTSQDAVTNGTAFIECAVSTYMRGINLKKSFVIIDEAENADLNTLAKVISRINDDCVAIVIGNMIQCDMYDKTKSGFTACIDYMTKFHSDIASRFSLHYNHRGKMSEFADLMLNEYHEPQYGFIYMTRNQVNGKLYIGQHKRTMDITDINDSWYLGSGKLLKRAIQKYGEDNFERTIIYECKSAEELNYMEEMFIEYYNAVDDNQFYNIVKGGGGVGGIKFSEESIAKMIHSHIGQSRPMSEDQKKKLSEIAKNRSSEIRKKYSEARYKYIAEHGTHPGAGRKKVVQIDKDTLDIIAIYESETAAGSALNVPYSHIARACRGERKTAYGYKWKFAEDI